MKICVLGAGVVGVTTAYMLTRAGHDVVLIEQASGPATGTSKANGAQLSYSYVEPFASPATARKLTNYLLGTDPGIKLGLSLKPSYLAWGVRFLRNCRRAEYEKNFQNREALAELSRSSLDEIEAEIPNGAIPRTGKGKLVIAEDEKTLNGLIASARFSPDGLNELQVLNKLECAELAPTLGRTDREIFGGVYCETDEALDTQIYCSTLLSANVRNRKPVVKYDERFETIELTDGRVSAVLTHENSYPCDAVIACLGGETNKALNGFIKPLPIYPVQGYSITLPATAEAPVCSITDLKHKFVIANLGDAVRIAGFMDTNLSPQRSKARAEELLETARRLWPGIADYNAEPNFWIGQRPMTPEGLPVIKESRTPGLYINAGHGSMGYTFAAGSAARVVELVGRA